MTTVIVELAVGDRDGQVSLAAADAISRVARNAGAAGIRLVDDDRGHRTIDPSIVGSYLAGRHADLGYLIDTRTTHNAPYNLARRVLSMDRATDGRVGVVLRPGRGDEVSDSTVPDRAAVDISGPDAAQRWSEYAEILTRLWESFPLAALVGDQGNAVFVDDSLIRAIDHEGSFYRVAGPLDGPSSVQGRPVVVAADPESLGWSRVGAVADAVIVEGSNIDGAHTAMSVGLVAAGRRRTDVALLARVGGDLDAETLARWASVHSVDGFVLAPTGGERDAIEDVVRHLVPQLAGSPGRTLRAALGLRETAAVLA